MEARGSVIELDRADHQAVLFGDDALLEEPDVVPLVVVVARLFHGPRVVRVAAVGAGHPRWVVGVRECAQTRSGGRHWSRDCSRHATPANVISVTPRGPAPAGSPRHAAVSPSRNRGGGAA